MVENSNLKLQAKATLKGYEGKAAIFTLLYLVIVSAISAPLSFLPGLGSLIASVITIPIGYVFLISFLRLLRINQQGISDPKCMDVSTLFTQFNGRIIGTLFLEAVYIFLWSLLLIIPGIIKTYSYAMTEYILEDNPDLEYNGAIEASMAMMDGKKMKLFLLDLSFIGWFILCILTLGILWLWVGPYWYSARAAFYEDIK